MPFVLIKCTHKKLITLIKYFDISFALSYAKKRNTLVSCQVTRITMLIMLMPILVRLSTVSSCPGV